MKINVKEVTFKEFTLTLTQEEANMIRSLCSVVSGFKHRDIANNLFYALCDHTQELPIKDCLKISVQFL